MATLSVYQANGFYLLSEISANGLITIPAAAVNIVKGDYVVPSAGYATNTATAFQVAQFGIANANANNSAGASGDISVQIIPLHPHLLFSVPVAANALITRAAIGTIVDLEANDDIDISDTTIVASSLGFFIEDIDVSAKAVAANTYGYAIGRFRIAS